MRNALSIYNNNFFDDFFNHDMKSDIKKTNNGYEIDIEIPGFNKDEVNVCYDDGYLTVSANHKENHEQKKHGKLIHQERTYSALSRSYYIGDVNKDMINAKMDNGLLKICVPEAKELPNPKQSIMIE